jgi:hypothetical protein
VVERTDGVTASFFRELLRRAALLAADRDGAQVTDDDVQAALDELLSATSALTRSLLGVRGEDLGEGARPPSSRGWLQAFPDEI